MTTANAISASKAARGAKHTCQECEVRFYDLLRDPIVCPSCGAIHTPPVRAETEAGRRPAPTGKTGWRQNLKRPSPVAPQAAPEDAVRPEAAAADDIEEATEEVADAAPEDDIVLDPEADESDVSDLVEHDVEEPKDR
jgi:uncharacterized protein (TIGR02300 family)